MNSVKEELGYGKSVVSLQHSENISLEDLCKEVSSKVIREVFLTQYFDENTIVHINSCGEFIIGRSKGDSLLTGRKIIVDTYGSWVAYGARAFSGQKFHENRSSVYAARLLAKSLLKAGIDKRCLGEKGERWVQQIRNELILQFKGP
uniref:S-adenosylmethionine synthetase C-terminal domain-containing protein n=1 Tax=Megaselia scalaris TaxID=36166 RepID=T1GRM6_MEGSC